MPSFDIVVKLNEQEVDNAVNQAQKELAQRYDFKGSKCEIKWDKKEIILIADDDFKLKALTDILQGKLIKRNVSIKNLVYGKAESSFEGTLRQKITLQQGIPSDKAKELIKKIKDTKIKVQSQIQDEQVRVTGKKRDELQEVIAFVRATDMDLDFQFENFRD
jgi:uncharacterized protein YajQ (UPF0234 family)